MDDAAEFIRAEIPEVAKIFRRECWLEGERRGEPVGPRDAVVQERVANIILNGAGADLRRMNGGEKKRADPA